jgi:hypothetical protein
MRKALTAAISAALFLFVGTGSAVAQDEDGDKIEFRPVEGYVCHYKEGKGSADLKAVNEEWNAWMDEQGANDYFAVVLAPHYHPDYEAMDFVWVGGWRDGNAMGAGIDAWMAGGGEIGEKWSEMSTCSSGSQFISMQLRAPQPQEDDEDDDQFVVSFSNCSLKSDEEGAWDEYMAANKEWNAYAEENDIPGSAWLWFPSVGTEDEGYDFKVVAGWDDHTMRGAGWAKFAEGHWRKSSELFDDKVDCDNGRLYNGWSVRGYGEEE